MFDLGKIRKIRDQKGLSLLDLARLTGLSYGYIGKLERRVMKNPSIDIVERIAKALNCSPSDFLADEAQRQPETQNKIG